MLYKLDKHGYGEEILLDNLVANQTVSFVGFTHDMFVMVRTAKQLQSYGLLLAAG